MTANEMKMLRDWQDERHREMLERFDGLDDRLEKIEDSPRLTAEEIAKIRIAAVRLDRAAAVVKFITPKKVAATMCLPSLGGLAFLVERVKNFL
jgi:uncharacterized protein YdcH (DUF465 family)